MQNSGGGNAMNAICVYLVYAQTLSNTGNANYGGKRTPFILLIQQIFLIC